MEDCIGGWDGRSAAPWPVSAPVCCTANCPLPFLSSTVDDRYCGCWKDWNPDAAEDGRLRPARSDVEDTCWIKDQVLQHVHYQTMVAVLKLCQPLVAGLQTSCHTNSLLLCAQSEIL